MAYFSSYMFQDGNSAVMEQLVFFHDYALMILLFIIMLTFYLMIYVASSIYLDRGVVEYSPLEIFWSLMPILLLVSLAMPSLKILYQLEEFEKPLLSLKILGHQWYWTYQYPDWENEWEINSYMEGELKEDSFRLLEVDHQVVLPYKECIRMLVSASDVIHAWTIPALGLKMDAVPGRINQIFFSGKRSGLYFGQCSEICGANHSFMPIQLELVGLSMFLNWFNKN